MSADERIDITNEIKWGNRTATDVEYICPRCGTKQTDYDVYTDEYFISQCYKCGNKYKYIVHS